MEKKLLVVTFFCVMLLLGILASCKPSSSSETVVVKVSEGASTLEIAQNLEDAGVIGSARIFYYWARFFGNPSSYEYGTYVFTKGMSFKEIEVILGQGTIAQGVEITVFPGWSVKRIGMMLEEKGLCTEEDFLSACDSLEYESPLLSDMPGADLRRHVLEGYLGADTIEVLTTDGAKEIAERLLKQMENILLTDERIARMEEIDMSIDEVLVLASVVEKEANNEADMKRVARVFLNRNALSMAWESCPTVWYALGKETEATLDLYFSQIEAASYPNCEYYRYNTYVMYQSEAQGDPVFKPIGPICSPSAAAIDAVLYPADENDKALYFFYDEKQDVTRFFDDYQTFYKAAYN